MLFNFLLLNVEMAEEGAPAGSEINYAKLPVRKYNDDLKYIKHIGHCKYAIQKGFVPNMNVDGVFYVNNSLKDLVFEELEAYCSGGGYGGFLPTRHC